jgi:putative two-component system response regulator
VPEANQTIIPDAAIGRPSWLADLELPSGPALRGATILIVDPENSAARGLRPLIESQGYHVIRAGSSSAGLELLDSCAADLAILATGSPAGDELQFCRGLREQSRMELIPVLVISSATDAGHEIDCMAAGADGYLSRPYPPELLYARLRSMLRHKAVVDQREESQTILLALAQAVEHRDNITAGHCDRLATLCVAMGIAMDLPGPHLLALHRGGYLHDIGKIGVPDAVLFKPGPLNEEEWRIMRTHPAKGEEICRPMKCLEPVLPIIRSHHERWDGSGYPDRLAGQNIPLLARVLQFADIYDALTSERSYKAAMGSADALRVMQEETNRGWHDPELMALFLRIRHENLRDAAEQYAEEWQDVRLMRESLINLRSSILLS